jgi:hypothetical protein
MGESAPSGGIAAVSGRGCKQIEIAINNLANRSKTEKNSTNIMLEYLY